MDRGRPPQVPVDPGESLGPVDASRGLVRPAGLRPREQVFGLDGDTSDTMSTGTGQTGPFGSGGNCP